MVDPLRDVLLKAIQSNTPIIAVEAAVRDHPDLPEASKRC
jgi:hypothetical protein